MILIHIYSGWRPQELAVLKVEDVNLEEGVMIGGMKTDAGKGRRVPIHPLIKDLLVNRIEDAKKLKSDLVFNDIESQTGIEMTYDKYRRRFTKAMMYLQMTHRPHESRHIFVTIAKSNNMNEYILKLIVGHSITDITEKVYTHRTMEQLKSEMETKVTKFIKGNK